jgi:hypothetical protein
VTSPLADHTAHGDPGTALSRYALPEIDAGTAAKLNDVLQSMIEKMPEGCFAVLTSLDGLTMGRAGVEVDTAHRYSAAASGTLALAQANARIGGPEHADSRVRQISTEYERDRQVRVQFHIVAGEGSTMMVDAPAVGSEHVPFLMQEAVKRVGEHLVAGRRQRS